MPSICQLCTHQQSEGDMMRYKGFLSRFESPDIFQVDPQRINKSYTNVSALALLLCPRWQRVGPLSDDGFRRGLTGETAAELLFSWERDSGAWGPDWNWLLYNIRFVSSKHFGQVDSRAGP